MRFPVLALMVILLLARGWMGDAMATGAAVGLVTAPMTTSGADMPPDCPMHAEASAALSFNTTAGDSSNAMADVVCGGCDACELCLAFSFDSLPPAATTSSIRHSVPLNARAWFADAGRLTSFKPPIS